MHVLSLFILKYWTQWLMCHINYNFLCWHPTNVFAFYSSTLCYTTQLFYSFLMIFLAADEGPREICSGQRSSHFRGEAFPWYIVLKRSEIEVNFLASFHTIPKVMCKSQIFPSLVSGKNIFRKLSPRNFFPQAWFEPWTSWAME